MEDEHPDKTKILFFIPIHTFSNKIKFIICTVTVFLVYIIYGFFQELLFKLEGFKPYGMYLTFIQFLFYILFSFLERLFQKETKIRLPLKHAALLAVLTTATMALSNMSVGYLNYPTQVMFKSAKLIPVLVGGILIQGKSYQPIQFVAAAFISLGLALFTLVDSNMSPYFTSTGIILVSLALVADAIIGNFQEKVMAIFSATNSEIVLSSYALGSIYLLVLLIYMDQLAPASQLWFDHPFETYGYTAIYSLCGYIGLQAVLVLIKTFGIYVAVTITTCRKVATIILSFLVFSKPFSLMYVFSGAIVFLGIYFNLYHNYFNTKLMSFLRSKKRPLLPMSI